MATPFSQTSFIGMAPELEAQRLSAVRRYDILDTPPDGAFDRVTAMAASLLNVPIAIISIVDHDRIWFKSHHGLGLSQIPRDAGLCASAILQDEAWVVNNAITDTRTLANPLVAGEFGLRFYVAVPLHTRDGHNLGTLCVLGHEPREISKEQIGHLHDLASVVMDQLELRLSAREAVSRLSDAIAEKDAALAHSAMMAREVDHRVMNSLQLLTTMLELQSQQHQGSVAGAEIGRAAGSVHAIARVHQHIHLTDASLDTDATAYLERLCDELSRLVGDAAFVTVSGEPVMLNTDQLVSLGLVVNELVTNAIKQGARGIDVNMISSAGKAEALEVCDDGPGWPEDFASVGASGLGMKVVVSLARQLGDGVSFANNVDGCGAQVRVSLRKA